MTRLRLNDRSSPELPPIDPAVAARAVLASADLAVIVDSEGLVRDVARAADAGPPDVDGWRGRRWLDLVAGDSRSKAEALMREAQEEGASRPREINHPAAGISTFAVRYSALRISEDGSMLALGRDLSLVASMQQDVVAFQRQVERRYAELASADARHRLFFLSAVEPALIVEIESGRVVEANPAAAAAIGLPASRLVGKALDALFSAPGDGLAAVLRTAAAGSDPPDRPVSVAPSGRRFVLRGAVVDDEGRSLLLRLGTDEGDIASEPSDLSFAALAARLPDALVVTDPDGAVQTANAAFAALVGLASPEAAERLGLERWLGATAIDFGTILERLREAGRLVAEPSVLRRGAAQVDPVLVSAALSGTGARQRLCFVIRPGGASARREGEGDAATLVGRVPLREIVRRATDEVERACIEAALAQTRGNRAAAADRLGLSRQSLYLKLRRFGLLEPGEPPEPDAPA